jgi:tetratricopeptide (TPR) repeat protein
MVMGFSFGEAAYASQAALSWQNIAIGDPLYRPFAKNPKALHQELEERKSWLLPWSVVRWVNLNLAQPDPDLDQWISYLENIPLTRTSAVMKEKLADLYLAKKKISDALDSYELVLKLNPTPQQKLRILLLLAQKRSLFGPEEAALQAYQQVIKEYPNYPALLEICRKALPLAQKFGKKDDIETLEKEIKQLSPVSSNGNGKT